MDIKTPALNILMNLMRCMALKAIITGNVKRSGFSVLPPPLTLCFCFLSWAFQALPCASAWKSRIDTMYSRAKSKPEFRRLARLSKSKVGSMLKASRRRWCMDCSWSPWVCSNPHLPLAGVLCWFCRGKCSDARWKVRLKFFKEIIERSFWNIFNRTHRFSRDQWRSSSLY